MQQFRRRFGLGGSGEQTLDEVNPAVCRERNRQVLNRGLRRLRGILAGEAARGA